LLVDPKQREQLTGQVLIVDEAGMVASKDMAELIGLAKKQGARIVYSGDTAQIKSVSEGDALRVLERESNLKTVSLVQVQRQTNANYKAAVESLRVKTAEGYPKLEAMGAIREVDWRFRGKEVSKAYHEAVRVPNARGEARSVLVIAPTHDEIRSITHAIRQDRKNAGALGQGETLTQHTALTWTEAQKKQTKNYQPGHVLGFHKAVKGVSARNESLEVVTADKRSITARNVAGQAVKVTARHAPSFAVFEKQEIEVAAGDKLLLEANWRQKDFRATNGELVTVAGVEQGRIRLEDGRLLPPAYRQFTHGYAVTAHRSQAKTVDVPIVAADKMTRDDFYVAVTRGRESLVLITSDTLALQESIGVSGDRQSAMELAKRAAAVPPAKEVVNDDLFRLYEAQQPRSKAQQSVEQEIRPNAIKHDTGISLGF
jgi:ATP-dependent exoDNAse (exonuclease V) alpha subunit